MDTLVLKLRSLPCPPRSSSGLLVPKMFLVRREGGSGSSLSVVQKRFKFPENAVELYSEKVSNMASVPLRRLSLFVTSSLEALLFA
ncbi:hypothetical protein OIU74_016753, partial [Salix koriyanagi]